MLFMHRLCFLPVLQNALLPARRRLFPQETHVLIMRASWDYAFALFLHSPLAGCIPVQNWLCLISAGSHRSPSTLPSHPLTTCTLSVLVFGCVPCKHCDIASYTNKGDVSSSGDITYVCFCGKQRFSLYHACTVEKEGMKMKH